MNNEKAKHRINELIKSINYHNNKYYNEDSPQISDYEYDMKLRELETLEKIYPNLVDENSPTFKVGGIASSKFKPVKHDVPMQSLHDSFSKDELRDFDARIRNIIKNPCYVVEPKIDGLSVSLEYKNSVLIRASTRGDGITGEDITDNIRTIKTVPLKLNQSVPYLEVRAEVYMSDESFLNLVRKQEENGEKVFKNPRNAAAGSLRQKDSNITSQRNLDIFIFNIQQVEGQNLKTHIDSLNFLKAIGFKVVPFYNCYDDIEDVLTEIKHIGEVRGNLDFPIDGAVVKLNSISDRQKVGATSKFPKWAEAFKYPPEEKETQILDIEINVGRTGVLTPTAIFKPVLIAGSTVSRAVLHNEDFIKLKDIRINDIVIVRKAGEIIPEVVKVKSHSENSIPFEMPDVCPSCGSKVSRNENESALRCYNIECPAQLLRRLIHFVSKDAMNIETLGPSVLEQLVKENIVNSPVDLYKLKAESLYKIDRMGEKTINNILSAIEGSKSNDLYRLIFGLGIRHIGVKAAKLLAQEFHSIEEIMEAKKEEISAIDGFGDIMADSVKSYFSLDKNRETINTFKELGLNVKASNNVKTDLLLKNKIFVLTGTLQKYKRSEATQIIESLGGKVTSSISKKTDYLLFGENPGGKLEKARDFGVQILSEEEFEKLKDNN